LNALLLALEMLSLQVLRDYNLTTVLWKLLGDRAYWLSCCFGYEIFLQEVETLRVVVALREARTRSLVDVEYWTMEKEQGNCF